MGLLIYLGKRGTLCYRKKASYAVALVPKKTKRSVEKFPILPLFAGLKMYAFDSAVNYSGSRKKLGLIDF